MPPGRWAWARARLSVSNLWPWCSMHVEALAGDVACAFDRRSARRWRGGRGARRVDGVEVRARSRGDATPSRRNCAGSVRARRRRGRGGPAAAPRAARTAPGGRRAAIESFWCEALPSRRRARSFREVRRPTWSSSGPCLLCSLSCLLCACGSAGEFPESRKSCCFCSGPRARGARRGRPLRRARELYAARREWGGCDSRARARHARDAGICTWARGGCYGPTP